ncbi:MAG: PspC domain-containing protein [Lachnospiraceae bacterium]|nr:PspC domain-containing protein [Lachnospiraceae bacterium]
MGTKLMKSTRDRKICGVCGGIAEYLHIDSTLVRIIWAIAVCCFGSGLLLYFIAALIMPQDFGYNSNRNYDRNYNNNYNNNYNVYDDYNTNYRTVNNDSDNNGYYSGNSSNRYPLYTDRK